MKIAILLLWFFGSIISLNAQNVTVTKPQKKTTSASSDNSSNTSNKTTQSNSKKTQSSNKSSSRTINGHEWVDLGLSVKWATCNVGASSPSDYGNYYAWGETKTKSEYTSDNSVTNGKNLGSIAGNPTYDAARANWGSTWRLPTEEEIDELVSKCKREWTTQGGHNGYKITGPNGNSIFLPAAGWRDGTSLEYTGEHGYFWSATPNDDTLRAYYLIFGSEFFSKYWYYRHVGRSVRPVSK